MLHAVELANMQLMHLRQMQFDMNCTVLKDFAAFLYSELKLKSP